MCDCITKVSDATIKRLVEEKKITVFSGHLLETGIIYQNGVSASTYTNFEYRGERELANGKMSKQFRKSIPVIHSFCPFCGEKRNYDL